MTMAAERQLDWPITTFAEGQRSPGLQQRLDEFLLRSIGSDISRSLEHTC
jgi:hypothetical protein